MAFIYDLTDTWNNAGISFNGIKLNATDTASAAGSKLLDLQISGASKFTVGKTGTVIATGLIESTVGGFKFPDGTTQTTKATVNSVSGTGTVNGITLTGTVTDSGSLTLGGTLGNIANNQLTNSAITINGTSTPLGGSIAVGTVTSVSGTGTVSGLSLTGSITTAGSLTLGGTLVLTSGQVTDALGYTPYDATNPTGYITASALTPYLTSATAATTYQPLDGDLTAIAALAGTAGLVRKTAANTYALDTAVYITGITSGDVTTALGYTPYNATNPAGYTTNVGTVTNVTGAGSVSGLTLTGDVTTSGALTLGGTLSLTSSDVTTGLGFTPYNATNPSGYLSSVSLTSNVTGTLPIANGGTGATTASGARTALGLGTAAVLNAGVSGGVATLDGSGTVPTSQLPGAVLGGLNYQGTWNASTNTPTLASSTGSKGHYYVVSVAGSTNLDGITDWKIGDWAVYDGSAWQKVDNTDAVSSVNGYTGTVVLTTSDVAEGTNLYFTQAAARGSVSAGTGISYDSGTGVITNSAPDQTVALTGAGTTVVTGTYPSFTITSNDSAVGTVTSVAASGGTTGLSFTGSPITSTGTLTLGGTLAVANGGTGATDAATALTNLGAYPASNPSGYTTNTGTVTSVDLTAGTGISVSGGPVTSSGAITVTNTAPDQVVSLTGAGTTVVTGTYPNFTVTSNDSATGTVTSVGGTGTVNGITLTGTVTSSGSLTLGGTLSGVNLTSQVTGTLPVANGGTGATSLTSGYLVKGNGTSAVSASVVYDDGTNVGIGTSSPDIFGRFYSRTVGINSSGTTMLQINGTTYGGIDLGFNGTRTATILAEAGGFYLQANGSAPMVLVTNGSERMRIDSSGNVGIGTSSPGAALDVAKSSGSLWVRDGTTGNATIFMTAAGSSYAEIQGAKFGVNFDMPLVLQRQGGNVGIGTSSPGYKLQVNGTMAGVVASGANYSAIRTSDFYYMTVSADGLNTLTDANGSAPMLFRTGGSERMRIDSSGNVGIGTTSPTSKFQVNGGDGNNIRYDGATDTIAMGVSGGAPFVGTLTNAPLRFLTNVTEKARIDTSGNLLVGTTSNSLSGTATTFVVNYSGGATHGCNFNQTVSSATYYTQIAFSTAGTVVGEIRSNNTATQYNTSSDARLKHDIVDAPEASSLIDAIQVRSFKWNADNSEQRYGFIAQELITVAPEAVSHDPDDDAKFMGVDYSKLVPMLVKEIQSMRLRLAQLEGN